MNYVTENTAISHNVPFIDMARHLFIIDQFTNSNVSCFTTGSIVTNEVLRDIKVISTENKHKAVEAVLKTSYITEDEAKQLIEFEYVRRNEFTSIHYDEYTEIIIISCYENDPNNTVNPIKLFQLVYTKSTGKVETVGQEYLLD